jgi:hypothetical protein
VRVLTPCQLPTGLNEFLHDTSSTELRKPVTTHLGGVANSSPSVANGTQ